MRSRTFRILTTAALCSIVLLAGCREEQQIESYPVPKLKQSAEEPARKVPGRLLAAVVPRGERVWFFTLRGPNDPVQGQIEKFAEFVNSLRFTSGRPEWELPQGWSESDSSGRSPMSMRFATIEVATPEEPLELTVMPLPMQGDDFDAYLLQNVNRWRRQLALPPTTTAKLFANESRSQEVRQIETGGLKVTLVNLGGMMEAGETDRPPFAPFASPPGAEAPRLPPGAGGGGSRSPALKYEAPEEWSSGRMSAMRYAAFQVTDGGKSVEMTIIPLPVSGLLANVNRWRGMVGLEEITSEELSQEVEPIEVDGMTGDYVELVGPEQSILAVRLVRGNRAWFFKLQGDPELAEQEKERFEQFVKSVEFQ